MVDSFSGEAIVWNNQKCVMCISFFFFIGLSCLAFERGILRNDIYNVQMIYIRNFYNNTYHLHMSLA